MKKTIAVIAYNLGKICSEKPENLSFPIASIMGELIDLCDQFDIPREIANINLARGISNQPMFTELDE